MRCEVFYFISGFLTDEAGNLDQLIKLVWPYCNVTPYLISMLCTTGLCNRKQDGWCIVLHIVIDHLSGTPPLMGMLEVDC